MADNTNQLSALEQAARVPVPAADDLQGRFAVVDGIPLADEATYRKVMDELAFGVNFGDHMAIAEWTPKDGWQNLRLDAFKPLCLSPATSAFHYGQAIFEGIKAYKWDDGSVWTFRPRFNAARFNASARRMAMPEIPEEDFIASLVDLVRADQRWVPHKRGASMYLRPFMLATEPTLGAHPAHEMTYMCIGSPSGAYFKNGFEPVSIWVTKGYHRAGPGGTGEAKCSGNYAASFLPVAAAAEKGYDQVFFLDVTETYLEELGAMNAMIVMKDGTLRTPRLTGTVLEGGTRGAILQLMRDRGHKVEECDIAIDWLVDAIKAGEVVEAFGCGTAAIITPIGHIAGDGFAVDLEVGDVSREVYEELTGIQYGEKEDKYGWMYKLADPQ